MRDHSNEPDLHILSSMPRLEPAALLLVWAASVGVLVLWLVYTPSTEASPLWARMVPESALSLTALAASLALSKPRSSVMALRMSEALGVAVAIYGAVILSLYAAGFQQPADPALRVPAPQTALAFVLLGVTCAAIHARDGTLSLIVDLCTIALIGVVLFLLAGYVFFVEAFVGVGRGNVTAQHTLFCLALLTLVTIARRAQDGRMFAVFIGRGIGSQILRLVLPFIVLAPFLVFSVIGYLDSHDILAATYARAIAAPLETLAIIGLVSWMARYTNGLERELRRQSITDELTGVLNRRGFFAVTDYALRNAARTHAPLVLFYFDLDKLKETNDRFGHDIGSQLIKRFAELLSLSFRAGDVVARIGGDEFVVLANGDATQAELLLARLQQKVSDDNRAGVLPVAIDYSTGHVEVLTPSEISMDQVIARADALMYEQKQLKRRAA